MTTIDVEAETFLREIAERLVSPEAGECLACYEDRMLREFGCDNTLRFARAFRDLRAPRATALERTLDDGGACCDCEVVRIVFAPADELWTVGRWVDVEGGGGAYYVNAHPPQQMPPCGTVRRGSTQPCRSWQR